MNRLTFRRDDFHRHHLYLLGGIWLIIQLMAFIKFGLVTSFEATKYIEQARVLLDTGTYSSANFLFYSVQILLIAFSIKLNIGFGAVVMIQMVFNAISILVLYKLVLRFTSQRTIAFAATLFFMAMFFYHLYNVHLFTESLFFSFSIIYSYYLFHLKEPKPLPIITLLILLTLLIFTRPTGLLFIPPTLFFIIFRFAKRRALPVSLIALTGGMILFYFLLNTVLDSGGELNFLLPYAEEHVICGVPGVEEPHNLNAPINKNSVEGLWYIISHNTELFLGLAWKRFIAFWGVRRSFYSLGHNLFICIYFYTLYIFILIGLRKMFQFFLPHAIFITTYIFLVMITVLLSCDEWHNRFIFSILPFLLLLGTGKFVKQQKG